MTGITDKRLAEMVGAGVPCVPAQPGEIAAVVQELRLLRAAAVEPFAYTTQTAIDYLREHPGGSSSLFLPFDGMGEIKGIDFVPLYAGPTHPTLTVREIDEGEVSAMRKALAVYGDWCLDVSTLGELADLEHRMAQQGISLQKIGEWSAALGGQGNG